MKILIVDDNATNRYLLETLLSASGYEVQTASDGIEALERLSACPCDLIVSDILMPRMDGFQLCREVKCNERLRAIPFIFYTATYTDPKDESFAMSLGAARFIVKPQEPEVFIALMREALAARASGALISTPPPEQDQRGYYKEYNERLIRKLEDKVLQLERAHDSLARSEHRYRELIENANDIIYTHDLAGRISSFNRAAEVLTGYGTLEASGAAFSELLSPHPPALLQQILDENASGQPFGCELEIFTKDQRRVTLEIRSRPIWESGRVIGVQGIARDVTERKRHEERIRHLAYYDTVTGLPNRALILDRLGQVLLQACRQEQLAAVAFIDLDRFKTINDSLGHTAGDQLLCEVAGRVRSQLRGVDTLARLGGDEFLLLIPHIRVETDAAHVAQKVLATFAKPFLASGRELRLTASLGLSLFPKDGSDPETLIKHADAAMYRAKAAGRNGYQFFAAEMTARASERLALENALRRAFERGELCLHYQPQLTLDGARMAGVEALLRWPHPERGMVSPVEFIPMADEIGLIVALGEWVLRTASFQQRAWVNQGLSSLRVSVNLSPRQLQQRALIPMVRKTLTEAGLDPRSLDLEITESSLMDDPEQVIAQLVELRALGVTISMDDFGIGYSSLSYLKRLPLDRLKIDQSFVRDIGGDRGDTTIIEAILALAQKLGLTVVAEGVEAEAQLEFFRAHGCHEIQGYWFSRPLPPEGVAALMRQRET
jgi:diguanylate cyclase (GGDEF)-like protein/PAS domain S-box-containing protein